jgi:hypothetical protein
MSETNRNTRLRFESLEKRQVMAGDVDVFAIGGVLNIVGDSASNGIVIHSTSDSVVQVRGIDRGGAATTVNENPSVSFTGIQNIVISMGNGDDAVVLTNLSITGSVSAQLGNGDDVFGLGEFDNSSDAVDHAVDSLLGALAINGNFAISMGEDDNTVLARNVTTKWAGFSAGNGDDTFSIVDEGTIGDPAYVPGLVASKGLTLITGNGNNSVTVHGSTVMNVVMPLGSGDDTVSLQDVTVAKETTITGQDGVNTLTLERFASKSLAITLGVGNDVTSLDHVVIAKGISIADTFGDDSITLDTVSAKSLSISMGVGDDELSVDDVTVTGSIDIDMGAGNDHVDAQGISAKSLAIALGLGDDELTLGDVAITKTSSVTGSDGNDTVEVDGLSAKKLNILLGTGNDDVTLQHTPITGKAKIDGGTGTNSYTDLGSVSFGALKRLNLPTV